MLSRRGSWLLRRFRHCRRHGDEAGAVLVIWVVALVGLLAMTAMAVDLGNIAQTKEHAETAVQDAALSAVPDLSSLCPLCGGTALTQASRAVTQETKAVTDAETYLMDNYSSVTSSQFNNCAGLLPSTIYVWPAENCFGFFDPANPTNASSVNQSYATGLAVALPTQEVKYSVGQGAGLSQQPVSAVAYASLKSADNGYGMPFAYAAGGSTGLQCLKTSGSTACSGFTTGSGAFGLIDSPRYQLFQSTDNGGASKNNPNIETDLVLGVDHPLNMIGNSPAYNTEYCDAFATVSGCTSRLYNDTPSLINWGNAANISTGNFDATVGLFTGFSGSVETPSGNCQLAPRLNHVNGFVAGPSCSADDPAGAGNSLSGTPLLSPTYGDTFGSTYQLNGASIDQYLSGTNADGATAISSCPRSAGVTASGTALDVTSGGTPVWDSFNSCLSGYITTTLNLPTASSLVTDQDSNWIFSSSIEQSPRFGLVPLIAGSVGTAVQPIVGFAAAYLDVAYPQSKSGKAMGSIRAWVFPIGLIQNGSTAGFGQSDYTGGPYTATLCSLTAGSC